MCPVEEGLQFVRHISQCLRIFILVRTVLPCTDEIEGNASQGDKSCGVLKEICMSVSRKISDGRNAKPTSSISSPYCH